WLDQLIEYLEDNLNYLTDYFEKFLPKIKVIVPDGTYLVWLNFRDTGYNADKINNFLKEKARIGLNDGRIYGPGGKGFERINIGCPRLMLEEGLGRIKSVFG
ncbi:MAG: cystathionine beta-lyase, partial [Proteobacteria bacterium]|nr:cystathionine beta-lyase [Pseudomonadota bacterium]